MHQVALRRIAADRSDFDIQFIRQQQVPVILSDATAAWPAAKKWTLDYFGELLGDREYMAEVNLPQDVPIEHKLGDFQKSVRMRDFIESIKSCPTNRASYITNKSIDRFPGLAQDVDFKALLGVPVNQELTRLWIGTANTKSSLHFDYYENVLCQIVGKKRVYLVDPKYTCDIYQYASNIDKSKVDVEKPNLQAFPRFKNVTVHEGMLLEGDVLFIPRLWWHSVRSLDPSISINCFYGERAGEKELVPMMLSGGPRLIAAFIKDFIWSGLLGRPYQKRLYAAEPFGVWFYYQLRASLARRFGVRKSAQ